MLSFDYVLYLTEAFQFHEVSIIVYLSACTVGVLFRKLSPVAMCWRLFPTFSSIKFSVSGFMLRALIHLDLSFVQGDRYSICILLYADIQLEQHHLVENIFLFPSYISSFFIKKSSVHSCVNLCMGLRFNSIDWHVCFYGNFIVFLFFIFF